MTTTMAAMSTTSLAASPSSATPTRPLFLPHNTSIIPPPSSLACTLRCRTITRTRTQARLILASQVALKSDSSIESEEAEDAAADAAEVKSDLEKVGRKVRVTAPLKVYHIPKVPEFELNPDMVGVINQYVGFWKGKRISPNYPFKVQFVVEIEGRGPVKFFTHLKEDEFEIVDQ